VISSGALRIQLQLQNILIILQYFIEKRKQRFLTINLKGQYHEIFFFRIFHESSSSRHMKRTFFENSRIYSQVKVHHRVSTAPVANFAIGTDGGVDTSGKFAAGVSD
jgi:hypothetical protein